MRDRLPDLGTATSGETKNISQALPLNTPKQEAVSALCALGYKPADAARMVLAVASDDKTCEELIRAALQRVAR
jgi:Holliday junction DNA helicase RuvA